MPLRVRARQFQFTPLREGRRDKHQFIPQRLISIHAPPRGATSALSKPINLGKISIHAPPRGATRRSQGTIPYALFQFTPLREGRRVRNFIKQRRRVYFNSRPSARGDGIAAPALLLAEFQFTPLREGRRTCHGFMWRYEKISIHAPPRGATFEKLTAEQEEFISIHAPPRGATTLRGLFKSDLSISIHAPPRGATDADVVFQRFHEFQFTPLREGRRRRGYKSPPRRNFNSRPSARGDLKALGINMSVAISIHAPPRGATPFPAKLVLTARYFNSRPSARGDCHCRQRCA